MIYLKFITQLSVVSPPGPPNPRSHLGSVCHGDEGSVPNRKHHGGMDLNKMTRFDMDISEHLINFTSPDDRDGIQIDVAKEERH